MRLCIVLATVTCVCGQALDSADQEAGGQGHKLRSVLRSGQPGSSHGQYSPEQQQRLFSQMISDLRHAYADRLSESNKRLVELEIKTNQLESTLKAVLSGHVANKRETRLLVGTTPPAHAPHVAFYAQLTHDVSGIGNYQAIVFDLVETNAGSAYNRADGIFTAPVAGTYVFSWTTFNNIHTHMQTEIVVNNVVKGRTWSDAADHEDSAIASNTAVLELNVGDVVWIRSNTVHRNVINGSSMTSFSGWLLFTK